MYVYGTTLISANHSAAQAAAANYAAKAREVTGLNWAAYDHLFATQPEVVTVSATVASRAELAEAMTAIHGSPDVSLAYSQLRVAAPKRRDAMWFMVNPPPGEIAPAPKVISMWITDIVGSYQQAIGWALEMVRFVEGEFGQRYLVGANRTGKAGRISFAQYADSLEEDEARDKELLSHPETYARLSMPVAKGWLSSGGNRIIMQRID